MKARSVGDMQKGFSTIEMVMAFAVMVTVLVGVVLADFGTRYWTITSQTSNEALYKAKGRIEDLRAAAKADFITVASTPATRDNDASCAAGGLCYDMQDTVTDVSRCAKYVETKISWQVPGYPGSSTSLYTYLTNPTEAIALGGDCPLEYPAGPWTSPQELYEADLSLGAPTGIDAVNGVSYMTGAASPFLQVVTSRGPVYFSNGFAGDTKYNALDVARDAATGRTYAYVAADGTKDGGQFVVIDMTYINNPTLVASASLDGVTVTDTQGQGWRVAFYDRSAYVATRYADGPEFHVFDVVNPALPTERYAGTELGTSVNAIAVRDQKSSGANCQSHGGVCRFAYLATADDAKEVTVLDVTDPANVTTAATIDLPDDAGCSAGQPDAEAVALSGATLYVGRDYDPSCPGLAQLYAFDASDPYAGMAAKGQAGVGADVSSLRAAGPYLFLGTFSGGRTTAEIRANDPATLARIGSFDKPGLVANGLDFDGSLLYAVGISSPGLQVISNP
jgi:hypothetical protein